MNKLKVAFVDFWPEIGDENIFLPILKNHFDVEVTNKNPDLVIHSIFGGMKETPKYNCKKILFLGENYRPNRFATDFSISFDPHSDTNYQLPLWQFYILLKPEYKEKLFNRVNHDEFERFCSFTVSNGGNFIRNGMFNQLKSYKHVHSYGRFMTNDLGLQKASQGRYWRDAKDQFFSNHTHKFSIAYENNPHPYYTTEKLMDAFLAGSLPIYWGDPRVRDSFNTRAFINVMDYGSNLLDTIKRIDANPSLFDAIYNEPIFTDIQKEKLENNLNKFETWLIDTIKK